MNRLVLVTGLLIAALAGYTFGAPQLPQAFGATGKASGEPVLIELFTSQGCSSCPPADRLAAKLASESGVLVISRPVTYWDRLGWKDSLARPQNTALQQAYAARGLGGYNGVYTPQSVAAGAFGQVGSDEPSVRAMIRSAAAKQQARIAVVDEGKDGFAITLSGKAPRQAELMLVGVARQRTVKIGSGENGGRSLTYTNVVRGERAVAQWKGGLSKRKLPRSSLQIAGADRYALILRLPDGGPVLAARWLD
jgi:hypothetical protein